MDNEIKTLLQDIIKRPKEIVEIMKKHNIIIDNLNNKMQKYAFTLYTDLVEYSSRAENLLKEAE